MGVSRDCPIFFPVDPIISPTGKATNFKFGRYIHSVYSTKRLLKIWEKRECGCIQGWPKFFQHPLLSQERVKLQTSNLAGTCEQKPVKNLREKGAWAYPGTAQIFPVPSIISGTRRATKFKFGTYIDRVYVNLARIRDLHVRLASALIHCSGL